MNPYVNVIYNPDLMLGIIDAIGILDNTSKNITLTVPYINFHTSNNFLDMIKVPYSKKRQFFHYYWYKLLYIICYIF